MKAIDTSAGEILELHAKTCVSHDVHSLAIDARLGAWQLISDSDCSSSEPAGCGHSSMTFMHISRWWDGMQHKWTKSMVNARQTDTLTEQCARWSAHDTAYARQSMGTARAPDHGKLRAQVGTGDITSSPALD